MWQKKFNRAQVLKLTTWKPIDQIFPNINKSSICIVESAYIPRIFKADTPK